jgi:hypothetical protein
MNDNPSRLAAFFSDVASPRYLALFAAPNGFEPPHEIYYAHPGGETHAQALDRARQGGSRLESFVLERVACHWADWPMEEPLSADSYILRDGYFVVLVPSIVTESHPQRPPAVHIVFASADEGAARQAWAATPIRALLGRVGTIVAGDGGGEIGGIQKEGGRMWAGW